MDIYKCPKLKTQKNFPQKISIILYNKLKFLLKETKYNKLKFLLKAEGKPLVKAKHLLTSFLDSSYKSNLCHNLHF
jgi:hypothetical protein